MGVRFRSAFNSTQTGIPYKCEIWDVNYSSAVTDIRTFGEGFNIEYEQQSDERFNPIKGSTCKLKCLVTDDAAGLALQSWITSSVQATKEDQYFIAIYKNNTLFWFGVILPDLGTRIDQSRPYEYELSATDGLARLKNFNNPLTQDAIDTNHEDYQYTFTELIYSILKLCPLYIGTSETILYSTVCGWYEDQMAAKGPAIDPLAITKVNAMVYSKKDQDQGQISLTAYDVLEEICKSWGMRVMLSGGYYRFYQVNSYEDDAVTRYERLYQRSNGNYNTYRTFSGYANTLTNTDYPYVNAGNQFQFYAPLKNVYLKYPFLNSDMLDGLTDMRSPFSTFYYQHTLRNNILGGTGKVLCFATSLRFWTRALGPNNLIINISIKLKLGSKYLYKAPFSSVASWTNTSTDTYDLSLNVYAGGVFFVDLNFITPDIPAGTFNSNEFKIEITSVKYAATGTTIAITDYNVTRQLNSTTLVYNQGSTNQNENYFEYIGGNTATPINSYDLDLGTATVGEPLDPSNYSNLFVYNGSSWVSSTSKWMLEDTGIQLDFNLMRVREVLSGQTRATQKYQGSIIGVLNPHSSFDYNGFRFIFNGGSYNGQSETMDGEWYAVSIDRTPYTEIQGRTAKESPNNEFNIRSEIGSVQNDASFALLQLNNALTLVSQISVDTTLLPINQFVEGIAGPINANLPDAALWITYGKSCEITIANNAGPGTKVIAVAFGGQTINGASTVELNNLQSIVLISNGTNILIKSRS
jgi:hypothetical protein